MLRASGNHPTTYTIHTVCILVDTYICIHVDTEDSSPRWLSKVRSEKELHSTWGDNRNEERQ